MRVQQLVVIAIVVVLIVIGTYFEGMRTSRWGDPKSEVLDSYKAGVQDFPTSFGTWVGDVSTESRELTDLVAKEAGAEASLSRNYHSDTVGRDVMISVICGFSRKVAIHTPDACYRGAGFHIEGEITTVKVPYVDRALKEKYASEGEMQATYKAQKEAEFRTALFVREERNGTITRQRVFWTWRSHDSEWIAPEIPRNRWRPVDPLCKMYISTIEGPEEKPIAENPIFEFGKVFFPELEVFFNGTYVAGTIKPDLTGEESAEGTDGTKGDASTKGDQASNANQADKAATKTSTDAKAPAAGTNATGKTADKAAEAKPATQPAGKPADAKSGAKQPPKTETFSPADTELPTLDEFTDQFSEKDEKQKEESQKKTFLPELPSDILKTNPAPRH